MIRWLRLPGQRPLSLCARVSEALVALSFGRMDERRDWGMDLGYMILRRANV